MPIPTDISREDLLALVKKYDVYIQEAGEQNRYWSGWRPACINEFYDFDIEPERYDVELLIAWSHGDDHGEWTVEKFTVELDEPFSLEALRRAAELQLETWQNRITGDYAATFVYNYDFAEEDPAPEVGNG